MTDTMTKKPNKKSTTTTTKGKTVAFYLLNANAHTQTPSILPCTKNLMNIDIRVNEEKTFFFNFILYMNRSIFVVYSTHDRFQKNTKKDCLMKYQIKSNANLLPNFFAFFCVCDTKNVNILCT